MLPLAGAIVGLAALLLLVLVELGARTIERAEAQSAADMAALAGVHEGRSGAEDLAGRNRAELIAFDEVDGAVRVRVQVGGMQAEAWAALDWSSTPIPGAAP
jgi:uncharacterized membrane protein